MSKRWFVGLLMTLGLVLFGVCPIFADCSQFVTSFPSASGDGCGATITWTTYYTPGITPVDAQASYLLYYRVPDPGEPIIWQQTETDETVGSDRSAFMFSGLGEGTYWYYVYDQFEVGGEFCAGQSGTFTFGPEPWTYVDVSHVSASGVSGGFTVSWRTSEDWECRLQYHPRGNNNYSYTAPSTGRSFSVTVGAANCATYDFAIQLHGCGEIWQSVYYGSVSTGGTCPPPPGCAKCPPPQQASENPPTSTRLLSNNPNPFNPTTTISFQIARTAAARLEIYSVGGALVRSVDLGILQPGVEQWSWDGRNATGQRSASGVYYVLLKVGDVTDRLPIVLLK